MVFLCKSSMKFLGNIKDSDYKIIVGNMLACFEVLGCRTNFKVNFLHAHLDYFPQNLIDMRNSVPTSMGCIHNGRLLLVPETRL